VISEDNQEILQHFITQCREKVRKVLPELRILLVEPERDDLFLPMIGSSFELFELIRQYAALLQFEYFLAIGEAMGGMLESARQNQQRLAPSQASLLVEVCTFIDQGLDLIARENSDQRLAASATALQAAITEVMHQSSAVSENPLPFISVAPEIRDAFFRESEQLLLTAEQEFVLWDFIAIDHERVSGLCRILHRLKQNFSIYDCADFERLCMALESTLNRYIQGEFFQTEYPERVFLRCIDAMRDGLAQFALTESLRINELEEHLLAVQGLIRQPLGELLIEAGLVDPETVDDALSLQRNSRNIAPRRLGEVLVGMGEVTAEQVEDVLQQQKLKKAEFESAQKKLEDAMDPQVISHSMVPLFPEEITVDGQKLARMVSIIQQMTQLRLSPELAPFVSELDQISRSFNQDVNLGFTQHLQRIVRDFAIHFNKRVHFRVEGASILHEELDMASFTELLVPLLRNSIEHGVESVELRQKAQKKKNGRVSLTALRQGGELWVSVGDDGCGFDLKKIASLCFHQGLVSREELGNLTGAELLNIFLNNQNCAEEPVAEDVLRCTGLALVKKMLGDFNGKLDIWSRPGKGARVTLRIPRPS